MKQNNGTFDQQKYINDFKKASYDRMEILTRKGTKPLLKELAKNEGLSVNQLIVGAVEQRYNIDLSPKKNF